MPPLRPRTFAIYAFGSNRDRQCAHATSPLVSSPHRICSLAAPPRAICGSWTSSLMVTETGGVLVWGANPCFQLATREARSPLPGPTEATYLHGLDVSSVAAGRAHACYLTRDGRLICAGDAEFGQLGDGTAPQAHCQPTPSVVSSMLGRRISAIASGYDHVLAIVGGRVFAHGLNQSRQLGIAETGDAAIPTAVVGIPTAVVAVAAGADHSLAIAQDGTIWGWGSNEVGQLGGAPLPEIVAAPQPIAAPPGATHIAASAYGTALVAAGGHVHFAGQLTEELRIDGFRRLNTAGRPAVTIAAGYAHLLVALRDSVLGFGSNAEHQLGQPDRAVRSGSGVAVKHGGRVLQVAAGTHHSLLVVEEDGENGESGENGENGENGG